MVNMEVTHHPLPSLSFYRYWLSVGAQPSDTVARLLGQAGIIPTPPRKGGGRPGAARATGRGFAASAASALY